MKSSSTKTAGIYIHIPFCKSRCTYCDFYTLTNESRIEAFADSLCKEIELRKDEIHEPVKTVYFGGGTPSRLSEQHFENIFNYLFSNFKIDPAAEITVEANPDDLSSEYIQMLSHLPVNRLSIGIQSFDDGELKFLSRRHTASQAINAVKRCQMHGFNNISIDLMYGLPGQTTKIWEQNLKQATSLDIQHLSAYHLIYEEKTRMYSMLKAGKIHPVDEEVSTAMFSMLIDWMKQHNFIHYEISAFAKEGYFSRHNTSYWKGNKYIGLGPAAHSFDGENRSWNVASLNRYINGIESGVPERNSEHLSLNEKYNEFILTGLRTMWGIDMVELRLLFGDKLYSYCIENAEKYVSKKLLSVEGYNMKLTREGIFISDGIMSDLMSV
jgi:oxygen-independent coproporphyrinogen-3 oxidase